jgi:integrase
MVITDSQVERFLSPEEEKALMKSVEGGFPAYVPVLQLAIHTGVRTSELLRAQAGDYDVNTGKYRVRQRNDRNSLPLDMFRGLRSQSLLMRNWRLARRWASLFAPGSTRKPCRIPGTGLIHASKKRD